MPELVDIEDAYNQAWYGTYEPAMMTIWCDHSRRSHCATVKNNNICATLAREIREVQRQAGERAV